MKHDVYDTGATATRPRQDTASGKSDAEREEIRKRVEAAATPGPAHKALDAFVGNWKAEVKCWMEPGGQPEVSQATAKASWILNGHFLQEEFNGQMMGKPFRGVSLLGFDNLKQTYNSVWISDGQTSVFTSEGKGDSGNKVITLEGKTSCAATGRRDVPMKTVLRVLSPERHVFEMFDGNAKTLEITYTRQ